MNRIPNGLIEVKINEPIILLPEVMYASHKRIEYHAESLVECIFRDTPL